MPKLEMRSSLLLLAGLSLLAACAPEAPSVNGEEHSTAKRQPIINGTPATGYSEAVLIDMYQGGQIVAACSGSLISPRVVLTAGHCVQGMDGWDVSAPYGQGQSAHGSAGATYDWNVTTETVDPNKHDIGLVFLDADITLATYPALASAAVSPGTQVQNIGRIDNGTLSSSGLFLGPPAAVESGSSYGYPYSYASTDVIQSGDSGGPVVLPGTHEIVAVNSGAGSGMQVLARVDLLSSWIAQQVAQHPSSAPPPSTPPSSAPPSSSPPSPAPAQSGCGSVTYAGDCQGGVLEWCENGKVSTIDCAAGGATCGFDPTNQFYNCL